MHRGDLTEQHSNPLSPDAELPFHAAFHPLGFRVDVASSSPEVLECARESWGMWEPQFASDPVEVRVIVQEQGEFSLEPEYRAQGHLFSIVSDRENYAVMDLDRLFAYGYFSRKTVADHVWFRWFFLDTMGLFMLAQRHVMAVHAACVARDGRGILLAGDSCAGKSTLAWACARAGWTYVGDDASWFPMNASTCEILGRPHLVRFRHDAPELFPEIGGYLSRVRPNGKLSIEVPTSAFPEIQTASRCPVEAVVFLDRASNVSAGMERMDPAAAVEELLGPRTMHREETFARHRSVVQRAMRAPAYRMRYQTLEEGISLLGNLHEHLRS